MLKLIKCTPKSELFRKAYVRKLEELLENEEKQVAANIMSIIFLGVRAFSSSRRKSEKHDIDYMMVRFRGMEALKGLMSLLTPRQFMNVFPITKKFDGAKYDSKDYFYTMEMIRDMDMDAPINDKINDFLWDYMNWDISLFQVELFGLSSDIMRAQGQPGLMERMSADFGMPIYTLDKKEKKLIGPIQVEKVGEEYYFDDDEAKTVPYKKPLPDYLKVVEGN